MTGDVAEDESSLLADGSRRGKEAAAAALPAVAPEPTAAATHGGVGVVPAAASALLVGAAVWAGMAGLQKWRTGRGGGGEQAAALEQKEQELEKLGAKAMAAENAVSTQARRHCTSSAAVPRVPLLTMLASAAHDGNDGGRPRPRAL